MKISDLWGSVYCTRFFSRFFHDLCTIGFGGSTCSDRLQPCHGHWSSTIPFDLISCGSRHCENALVARCRPNQLMYTVQVVRFPCPCWHAYVYAMYNMYSKYHVLLYVSCIFLCIYIYIHTYYVSSSSFLQSIYPHWQKTKSQYGIFLCPVWPESQPNGTPKMHHEEHLLFMTKSTIVWRSNHVRSHSFVDEIVDLTWSKGIQ